MRRIKDNLQRFIALFLVVAMVLAGGFITITGSFHAENNDGSEATTQDVAEVTDVTEDSPQELDLSVPEAETEVNEEVTDVTLTETEEVFVAEDLKTFAAAPQQNLGRGTLVVAMRTDGDHYNGSASGLYENFYKNYNYKWIVGPWYNGSSLITIELSDYLKSLTSTAGNSADNDIRKNVLKDPNSMEAIIKSNLPNPITVSTSYGGTPVSFEFRDDQHYILFTNFNKSGNDYHLDFVVRSYQKAYLEYNANKDSIKPTNVTGAVPPLMTSDAIEDGATASFTVAGKNKLDAPGYVFKGWSLDANALNTNAKIYQPGETISGIQASAKGTTTILYAIWEKLPQATLKYNLNPSGLTHNGNITGNLPGDETQNVVNGKDVTFTLKGNPGNLDAGEYKFVGWSTSKGLYEDNAKDMITSINVDANKTETVYAVWQKKPVANLVYDANLAAMSAKYDDFQLSEDVQKILDSLKESQRINSGDSYTFNINNTATISTVDDVFLFEGWSTSPGVDNTKYSGTTISVNGGATQTLYAVWSEVTADTTYLIYDANEASLAKGTKVTGEKPDDQVWNNLRKNTKKLVTIEKGSLATEAYAFLGWSTDPKATEPMSEYEIGKSVTLTAGNQIKLYAVWEALSSATLTYDANAFEGRGDITGTVPDAKTQYIARGEETVAFDLETANLDTKEYRFAGWSTTSGRDNKDGMINTGSINVPAAGTTVYAVWEKRPVATLKYDANVEAMAAEYADFQLDDDVKAAIVSEENEIVEDGKDSYIFNVKDPGKYTSISGGFRIVGWSTSDGVNNAKYNDATISVDGNDEQVLYAVWEEVTVFETSLTYDANEASLAERAEVSGQKPDDKVWDGLRKNTKKLVTIEKGSLTTEAYAFLGWSEDPKATAPDDKYAIGETVTLTAGENITLFAVWEALSSATLTYDENEFEGRGNITGTVPGAKTQYIARGEEFVAIDLENANLDTEAYRFIGWSTTSGSDNKNNMIESNSVNVPAAGTTVYAVWEKRPVATLKYDANVEAMAAEYADFQLDDGVMAAIVYEESKIVKDGETSYTFNVKPGAYTTIGGGFEFVGWSTSNGVNNTKYDDATISVDGDTSRTLYAVWKEVPEDKTSLTYNDNKASLATGTIVSGDLPTGTIKENLRKNTSVSVKIEAGSLTTDAYTFLGWSEDPNATAPDDKYAINNNVTLTAGKVIVLYAVWEEKEIATVTYNSNVDARTSWQGAMEGTAPNDSSAYIEKGDSAASIEISNEGSLVLPGYRFLGWSKNPGEDNTVDYSVGESYDFPAGNTTLYAVWEEIFYNLTVRYLYIDEDGNEQPIKTVDGEEYLDKASMTHFGVIRDVSTAGKYESSHLEEGNYAILTPMIEKYLISGYKLHKDGADDAEAVLIYGDLDNTPEVEEDDEDSEAKGVPIVGESQFYFAGIYLKDLIDTDYVLKVYYTAVPDELEIPETPTTDPTPATPVPGPGPAPAPAPAPIAVPPVTPVPATVPGVAVAADNNGNVNLIPVEDVDTALANLDLEDHICNILYFIILLATTIVLYSYFRSEKKHSERIFELRKNLGEDDPYRKNKEEQ